MTHEEELTAVDGLHYLHLKEHGDGIACTCYSMESGAKEGNGIIHYSDILDCVIPRTIPAARYLAI